MNCGLQGDNHDNLHINVCTSRSSTFVFWLAFELLSQGRIDFLEVRQHEIRGNCAATSNRPRR